MGNPEQPLEGLEGQRREVLLDRIIGWKLFYTNGVVLTSRDCAFEDAPQRGVAVLIRYLSRPNRPPHRDIQFGKDIYMLYPFDALDVDLDPKLKSGSYTHTRVFKKILATAKADEEVVDSFAMESVT